MSRSRQPPICQENCSKTRASVQATHFTLFLSEWPQSPYKLFVRSSASSSVLILLVWTDSHPRQERQGDYLRWLSALRLRLRSFPRRRQVSLPPSTLCQNRHSRGGQRVRQHRRGPPRDQGAECLPVKVNLHPPDTVHLLYNSHALPSRQASPPIRS